MTRLAMTRLATIDRNRAFCRLFGFASTLFALALYPAAASATPIGWSLSGGRYTNGLDDFFVGAGARVSVGSVSVIPNAEYVFVESGAVYTLNLDATLTVLPLMAASGWLGGGVGRFTVDPDGADAETETTVNLLAGVGLNAVPLKPYVQIKDVIRDGDDPLVFSVGVRF
jgi:hypothetical protein